ncbi:MAG: DUF2959 domain-containing protein [Xanthomonadales bacterium]|nr:DUF2959 domain-containing protein [Xanthomonadales bacterium]
MNANTERHGLPALVTLLVMVFSMTACSSAYYSALEKVGIEKRDILIDRIDDTRDAQDEAKEQFTSALEQYRAVIDIDGGELEKTYDRLNAEYERSEQIADEVSNRIDAVEDVAGDLFEEWEREIETYSDAGLARTSRNLLRDTRAEYAQVIRAMKRAEQSMAPVLTLFNDQVLFLRHNLNARAIGALQGELANIERATAELVAEMERSIAEADRFIQSIK